MYNDSVNLIVIDIIQWAISLSAQRFLSIAENQVDLPSNSFGRLGVIT